MDHSSSPLDGSCLVPYTWSMTKTNPTPYLVMVEEKREYLEDHFDLDLSEHAPVEIENLYATAIRLEKK